MIRVSRPLERHPSLTAREFAARHAVYANVFRSDPTIRRFVRAYVASSTVLVQIPGQPQRIFDGLSDLWFDDVHAYEAFKHDPAARSTIETISRTLFVQEQARDIVMVDRTPLIDGGQQSLGIFDTKKIRVSTLLIRNPALPPDDFMDYHIKRHAPIFASTPVVRRNVRRYAIAHRIDNGDADDGDRRGKRYDGIVDFWFDNMFDLVTTFVNPKYLAVARPDERRFLDLKSCDFIISRELAAPE